MKLQILLPICALAMVFILACNRKTTPPSTPTPPATGVTPKPGNDRPETEPAIDAYQVVGYQKTACFGKCPVFQVKFFSDGKVTWYGQMNVERMGNYETKVDKQVLTDIRDHAHAAHYWDFASKYPTDQRIADLPSTVTFIRTGDMEKMVVNTYQGPAELEAFQTYLEGVIMGLKWQPAQGK